MIKADLPTSPAPPKNRMLMLSPRFHLFTPEFINFYATYQMAEQFQKPYNQIKRFSPCD
jgi:hypothetical protein